ncbi:uncharacterized protein [Littorina saxatilis]|uniref:CARD domain-containing protein n=1 Tax=Littorina saxatilis TaxID=31220 RepID=A0AAN9G6B9_9CAEN
MNGRVQMIPQHSLSEDDLKAHLKCEVLEAQRKQLARCLIPDRHMDFLRSKYMLSEEDCEEISHPPTRQKRASKFLDILAKKGGAEAYDALCAALREEGTQTFLVKLLHEDFEKRLRLFRELVGQQRIDAGQLPISPPPIKPPRPPPHHRHGYIQPAVEHSSSGGSTVPVSPSSSCPGYASTLSSAAGWFDGGGEKEGASTGDKRQIVSEYLQSLTIRDEGTSGGAASSDLPSVISSMQVNCSTLSSSTGFSSLTSSGRPLSSDGLSASLETSTSWSLSPAISDPSLSSQSAPSAASQPTTGVPPIAIQVSEASGDHTINRPPRCHQRLSSRGSLQEMDMSLSPDIRSSTDLPSFIVTPADRPQPVENEEVATESEAVEHEEACPESSPMGGASFFASLDNQSLVQPPVSEDERHSGDRILCQTAVCDQEKALVKCLSSDDEKEEEEGNCSSSRECDVSLTSKHSLTHCESAGQLSCLSAAHNTERKTVNSSLSTCTANAALSSSGQHKDRSEATANSSKENGAGNCPLQHRGTCSMTSKQKEGAGCNSVTPNQGQSAFHTVGATGETASDSKCAASGDKVTEVNGEVCSMNGDQNQRAHSKVGDKSTLHNDDDKAISIVDGFTRQNRPSKHEASGFGLHSSKC